ncbi:hypothetical protein [Sphingomonas profundi]|uniref:hypothetical protein n=1 Tax=Alterirhizorhabdus profundi TaxID=2681549 RepID=UPI0012E917CC|nr:hypothetical protein [Sphingomonas profundi]
MSSERWLILRTSGGQTLPLARSLQAAGFDAWTPARTIRKIVRPGTRTEKRFEIDLAILPTFVFAREHDLVSLADAAARPVSPHPAFSIFSHGGRIPLIGDRDVAGLREEEDRAAATMQAMRDAETHQEAERIRIAAIKSEAARRRAMRAQHRSFLPGTEVTVAEMPALVGVTGVVEESDGTFASVRFGTQSWKIEAWRLSPIDVAADQALRGLAA